MRPARLAGAMQGARVTTGARTSREVQVLAAVFTGYAVWWALGLAALAPLVLGVLAAWWVLHRGGRVALPPGFGWWLLFLIWVALGASLLWVDAPGAQPGGGSTRLLVFGYRLAWYLTATAVLLWIGNASRKRLPDRAVHVVVGSLFVVATLGGLLGIAAPGGEFRSVTELVLPQGLAGNNFVKSLVHPEFSDVQMVLGRPEARPKAPFAFANTWGSVMALAGVWFVVALAGSRRRWKVAGAMVLVVAAWPVVASLNRGLWACVALGGVGAVGLVVLRHRSRGGLVALGLVTVVVGALALGPLGSTVGERFENQHSNDRRGQLLTATVSSVTTGSPVAGFGSTRDVEGSFASISGASTPDCPACGVPPLGTQGHLWLVLFSQGWLGLCFFLVFVLLALGRSWRCRTTNETLCTFVVGFFCIQVFVYDTLGMPLLMVMAAIALVWREQRESSGGRTARPQLSAGQLGERLRTGAPVAGVLVILGAGIGWWSTPERAAPEFTAEARIVLVPAPDYLSTGLEDGTAEETRGERRVTIDTEAALVLSQRALARVVAPEETPALREEIRIGAEPNSDILKIRVSDTSAGRAEDLADDVAESYLRARSEYLADRRNDLVADLRANLAELDPRDRSTRSTRGRLRNAVVDLLLSDASVGRVVRLVPAEPVTGREVVRTTSGAALGLLAGIGVGSAWWLVPRRSVGRVTR